MEQANRNLRQVLVRQYQLCSRADLSELDDDLSLGHLLKRVFPFPCVHKPIRRPYFSKGAADIDRHSSGYARGFDASLLVTGAFQIRLDEIGGGFRSA